MKKIICSKLIGLEIQRRIWYATMEICPQQQLIYKISQDSDFFLIKG